ncbi:MAG: hemolysin family protein [Woeseiaceae bacterium]|nr:hemolysin family protein [Woeseiaceae bacterium]
MLLFVTAVAVVLVVSFLCSIFESVLLSINHAQIESLNERNKPAGRLLAGFKRNIDMPIAAILILNTAAHTVGASVAGASYSGVFSPQTLWIFTIVFTIAVLLFTEIIPKTLGVSYAGRLATPVARGIQSLILVLRPFVILSEKISGSLRGSRRQPVTSIEEIRLLAALGRNEGIVGPGMADIIVGATRLRQMRAVDVMLPRQAVSFLSATLSRAEVQEKLKTLRYSRYPWSPTAEIDDAAGMVLVKELLAWLNQHPEGEIDWDELVFEPLIVPESKPLNFLLRLFQTSRRHMALVVDEYGDIEGIVTLEDVLEEIVGEIFDESDVSSDDIREHDDGGFTVRAAVDLRRVCSSLAIDWTPRTEFTSVGGLLVEELGRIPARGDVMVWRGHRFEVVSAGPRRAELVRITRLEPGDEAQSGNDNDGGET